MNGDIPVQINNTRERSTGTSILWKRIVESQTKKKIK